MTKNQNAPGEHPLFRAMVVMGGSLAVGCGGTTVLGDSKSGPHAGSSSGGAADMADAPAGGQPAVEPITGGAGGSTGTNTPGTGGTTMIVTGSGGARTGAGGVVAGSGGTAGASGAAAGGASEGLCSHAQLSCDPEMLLCSGGWNLPAGCTCDSKRPSTGADCAADEQFVCRQQTSDSSGQPLPPLLAYFDCACVPKADDCSNACKAAYPSPHADGFQCHVEPGPASEIVLCGCGFVYLR